MMKTDHLLKVYQIIARDDLQSVSSANLIVDAYIHFRDHHDIGGCLVTMVALLKMMSFVSSVKMSSDVILSQAEMLLHNGFADARIIGKADLLLGMGINTILFKGSIRAGQGILKAAYAIAKELDCKDIQLHALAGLNVACAHLGNFCDVRRFDAETELLFHQSSAYEQFIFYSGLISADLNSGRFESAEKYMIAAKGIAEQIGNVSVRSKIDFLEIVAAIRQSNYHRAIELLDAFLGFITTIGKVQLLGIAYSLMAQCQYSLSNLHPARQLAEKAVEILSDDITYAGH